MLPLRWTATDKRSERYSEQNVRRDCFIDMLRGNFFCIVRGCFIQKLHFKLHFGKEV